MELKYNVVMDNAVIVQNLNRLTNQVYKLLPSREEGLDWETPLETIIEELAGFDRLSFRQYTLLFSLLCKLEGLFTLTKDEDFQLFRRIIFECLGLIGDLKEKCPDLRK